jgi:DcmR-like sensory protein
VKATGGQLSPTQGVSRWSRVNIQRQVGATNALSEENPLNPSADKSEQPIRFAGSQLGPRRHICGFFRSAEEEYSLLLPFIKEGFDRGEKAFHVVNPKLRDDHAQRLQSAGIDVNRVAKSGQLELCDWEQAYFPDGRFDQDRMLRMWQDVLGAAFRDGYARTRLVAHMESALEDRDGVTDLIEYEARFNLIHDPKDPVICAYDLRKFSADVIVDVLRTHSTIIIGGILQENPFFVPPEEFLRELHERRPKAMKAGADGYLQ